jgi:pectin methylesterase-like acyl-CoA thioesterase
VLCTLNSYAYLFNLIILSFSLVKSSRVIGTGTFGCGTIIVEGEDFIAENITFENSAPQGSGQAVALRVTADRCAFYNCRFLGWQVRSFIHLFIKSFHSAKLLLIYEVVE